LEEPTSTRHGDSEHIYADIAQMLIAIA
jgi:hypothetical protein